MALLSGNINFKVIKIAACLRRPVQQCVRFLTFLQLYMAIDGVFHDSFSTFSTKSCPMICANYPEKFKSIKWLNGLRRLAPSLRRPILGESLIKSVQPSFLSFRLFCDYVTIIIHEVYGHFPWVLMHTRPPTCRTHFGKSWKQKKCGHTVFIRLLPKIGRRMDGARRRNQCMHLIALKFSALVEHMLGHLLAEFHEKLSWKKESTGIQKCKKRAKTGSSLTRTAQAPLALDGHLTRIF